MDESQSYYWGTDPNRTWFTQADLDADAAFWGDPAPNQKRTGYKEQNVTDLFGSDEDRAVDARRTQR